MNGKMLSEGIKWLDCCWFFTLVIVAFKELFQQSYSKYVKWHGKYSENIKKWKQKLNKNYQQQELQDCWW